MMHFVVVNESRDLRRPGDVSVFRDADAMCRWLEPWWVEDGEGFAFSAAGERILLGVDGTRVVVTGREPMADGLEIVRGWLLDAAAAVLRTRQERAEGWIPLGRHPMLSEAEARGNLPETVEGLIAYVGFTA